MGTNIHPIFERGISRSQRENRLGQKGCVLWLTGLSGSGKSTLALEMEKTWFNQGKMVYLLDGDNIRSGINKDLTFSAEDRKENIRRIAEVARLLKEAGMWVLCSFVSPTIEIRSLAKNIIGENDFIEIWVSTSLEECERRDVKGLYEKARAGITPNFTGISAPYEPPEEGRIEINTEGVTLAEAVTNLKEQLSAHYPNVFKTSADV